MDSEKIKQELVSFDYSRIYELLKNLYIEKVTKKAFEEIVDQLNRECVLKILI